MTSTNADSTRAAAIAATDTARRSSPPRSRVLVVDDDVLVRDSLRLLLEASGYEVWIASDGNDALELLRRSGCPDLVVTDLSMPGLGGRELVRALAEEPRFAELPIVVLSADAPPVAPVTFSGVVCMLSKPVQIEQLLAAVKGLCSTKKPDNVPTLCVSAP